MRGACEGDLVRKIVVFGALMMGVPAAAQDTSPTENIIVTATRTAIPLSDAMVPVEVITREEIELSMASDLAELLRFQAGIDIARSGGPGQSTSVFLRGTESNHTLVLVDGVRINPGTLGGAAVQNIAPEMIERVEIVKGARSALFGTDALGGVINIITRRAQGAYGEASAGAGSFDTRSGYFAMGDSADTSDFGVAINLSDTQGFPIRTDSDIDRGYSNATVNLHGGLALGNSVATVRHWSATGTTEYLDFFLSPLDQDFENRSTSLEVTSKVREALESRLVVGRMTDDIEQNQSGDFVESVRLSVDWQLSLSTQEHVFTGGAYYVDEDAASVSFGSGFSESTRTKALFLQDLWARGRQQAFVAMRFSEHDSFGEQVTWNAEYSFSPNERWTLRAGMGRAFRAPDATDRFGFGGNPNLAPELSRQTQFAIAYDAGGRSSVSLELYHNDIDDLIEFDLAAFVLKNLAEAEIRGAELAWDYRGEGYSVRTSVVKQRAEDPLSGARLLRRAEESATLSVVKDLGDHRLGLSLLAAGDRDDFGGVTMPGYAVIDLTGQFAIGSAWRLDARIENLFDREYETAAGFRMQKLSGFIELNYSWH